ncbi:Flp pilus assembly protein CpaB [Evansella sp. AB-P1]|uniref:Flp pilus assembly protein CpaB n=1 Tax=Evansella sp. AB-P1 TaxID=3037653 RepID=UPI00241C3937|nr:Flp pilus assembly protein CpaB [Evansella sp. AB-P1]MDG5790060.1 Flp pilus assembly protein CpaB [Evansella sp. AB-P1]
MRSKMVFILALLMGVITTFLFFQYIQQYGEAQEVIVENMVEVVVAKEIIAENQTITADMLEMIEVTEQSLHPQTVTVPSDIEGKFATTMIDRGEVILNHRLMDGDEEALIVSRKVKEGYRAVSVGVNIVQSVTNLIEPEDYVDVIFTEEVTEEDETEIKTEEILSKARVLAVGRKMLPPTNEQNQYVEYSSITLELEPDDANILINATARGSIHLTLHSKIISSDDGETTVE